MKPILLILPLLLVLMACSANAGKVYEEAEIVANSSEETQVNQIIDLASSAIFAILESEGIGRNMMVIDPTVDNPYIEIIRVDGKELSSAETARVEKLIKDTVFTKTDVAFNVTLRPQTKEEIRDSQWSPIFQAVIDETEKKFKEYRGFAYSFSPEPLQIIIKTDLRDNKSTSNREKIEAIEQYANQIIERKIEELTVEKIAYKIIIRNNDNEEIN
ncbi:hypothetical protein QMK38_04380 [Lysinibacillus fusiformis]|nr:hypothetical protein [Lysinibacillus fusiformis]